MLFVPPCLSIAAQTAAPQLPKEAPVVWVQSAVENELHQINDPESPLQYRIRHVDAKGEMVRIQIESRQGDVARLIEKNGRPLTAAENDAEIARLNDILTSPSDFLRHHHRDASTRADVNFLIREMPKAMTFHYTDGQPQRPGATGPQVVIDFHPDPNYKPPTMLSDALTGIEGRMWIDVATRHLTRIEGHFLKTVNFGYGVVARIYPGGTLELDQANAGSGRWTYSHLIEHLTVRAFMVKTMPENSEMTAADFHLLAAPIDFQQAVKQLLAIPVKTQ